MQFLDLSGVQSLWDAVKTRIENSKTIVSGQSTHATNPYISATSSETAGTNGSHYTFSLSLHNVASPSDIDDAKQALYGGTIPVSDAHTLTSLAQDIAELSTESNVTVEKLVTAETGFLATYVVKQNGAQVGAAINIPKDFLVKSGQVRAATASDTGFEVGEKILDFVVNTYTSDGTDAHILISVKDLVDAYEAGNGINTIGNDNVISIKIDNSSENFLTVGSGGLKLSGVQSAINTAKSEVIGTNSDTASSDTVKGAKKYADSLAGNYATAAQGALADSALQRVDTTTKGSNVKVTLGLDSTDNKKVIVNVNETGLTNALAGKADLVTNGTADNFVTLDANGNIQDSGYSASSFASASADNNVKDVKVSAAGATAVSVVDANKIANISIAEGSTNGTIAVNNTNVPVHGLGTAAYKNEGAFATAAQGTTADSAVQTITGDSSFGAGGDSNYVAIVPTRDNNAVDLNVELKLQDISAANASNKGVAEASNVKAFVENQLGGLDSNQTYATSGTASAASNVTSTTYVKALSSVKVTEADGLLATPNSGDVVSVSVDAAGAAKAAYDALLGTQSDTAGQRTIEGIYKEIASITGGSGSVATQINQAIQALDSSVAGSGTGSGDNVIATQSADDGTTSTATPTNYVLTKVVIVDGKLTNASTSVKIEGIPTATLNAMFVDTISGS